MREFCFIWALKEAYTKSLGLGLGLDFRRVECDLTQKTFRIDGVLLKGWQFWTFLLPYNGNVYVGALSNFIGSDATATFETLPSDALRIIDATEFVQYAVSELK